MADLERALEHCLKQIQAGEGSVESCLASFPDSADQLQPLLMAAMEISQESVPGLGPRARSRMRARLSKHMQEKPRSGRSWLSFGWKAPALRWAVALLLAGVLLLTGATWVAQAAVPGDPLYRLKRISENAWLAVSPNETQAHLVLTERRLEEWIELRDKPGLTERAHSSYQQALAGLEDSIGGSLSPMVVEALHQQEEQLAAVGLHEPMLGELLDEIPDSATPTPTTTSQPTLSPTELLDPNSQSPELDEGALPTLSVDEILP